MRRHILLLLVLLPGCKEYEETDSKVIERPDWPYIVTFVTGKFTDPGWEANAHRYMARTVDSYFRARAEPEDRVLLACLTDDGRSPLIWQGKPKDFKQEFATPDALRECFIRRSTPRKHVYACLAKILDYVSQLPPVEDGKAKAVTLILNDMTEDSPTKEADIAKASESLKRYLGHRAEIGSLWVHDDSQADYERWFVGAGLPKPYWQHEPNPKLYSFE